MMFGADVLGHTTRVMNLAEVLFLKTNRKSFDALARFLAHQRHHCARIDAARKKRTKRHFRHQSHAHGFTKDLDRSLTRFFLTDVELLCEIWLPVTLPLDVTVSPAQPVPRFELANRSVSCERRRNAHEREIVIE